MNNRLFKVIGFGGNSDGNFWQICEVDKQHVQCANSFNRSESKMQELLESKSIEVV
jgi:hypothetical protein